MCKAQGVSVFVSLTPYPPVLLLQVDKVVQLYETMLTRHTTMVVGPTGGGKSVVIHTLCQAQTKYDEPTHMHVHAQAHTHTQYRLQNAGTYCIYVHV